jgi:hypothetical protein
MKKRYIVLLIACMISASGCKKYLDVNTNPNAPETAEANLYLAPMIHWMVTSPQFDGRFIGRYTQNWALPGTALGTWDRQGYDPGSDNAGQLWRDVYWTLGQNHVDMMAKAEAAQRWDVLGVGYILKAWGWQALTDVHGEIIIKEAVNASATKFAYDSQEFAYAEVQRLLKSAITSLERTDGFSSPAYLAVGDKMYNGDRAKWIKFAYGMLAINLNHFSNKTSYSPDEIIADIDKSFSSNADDALIAYTNTGNDDTNFWGPRRGNFNNYRQTEFVVNLMKGSQFGGVSDPRLTRMLSPSPDGLYRGLNINEISFGALTTAQRPNNFYGYPATITSGIPTRYIFDDKSKMPAMTYSQLQFIKAEAALRKGDRATALTAYTNGVSSHIDFVNSRNTDNSQTPAQISAIEKSTFLASAEIIPTAANLSLSHIMSQKYIAQFGWGHVETWMDLRRFHYTDVDPVTGVQVFRGFAIPTSLYGDNGNLPVQRIRPRYNSEYVWNMEALTVIGANASDYHTKPLWITQP